MVNAPWDIDDVNIVITKHFGWHHLMPWGWSKDDLRDGIRYAYRIEQCGREKYELYVRKKGHKKIMIVYYPWSNEIRCISGTEGRDPA